MCTGPRRGTLVTLALLLPLLLATRSYAYIESFSGDPLDAWLSPACQRFYNTSGDLNAVGSRLDLDITCVDEDLYKKGRTHAMAPAHDAQEVVICDKYKFIYVEVRKAASTTIRGILGKYFGGVNYNTCGHHCTHEHARHLRHMPTVRIRGRRCHSKCLTEEEVRDYFIFSFVRDPVERFYSGFKEAYEQQFRQSSQDTISHAYLERTLLSITKQHQHLNEHLESQAFSLSTGWVKHANSSSNVVIRRLPLDFIGRVENLEEDMRRVLRLIQERNVETLPEIPDNAFDMHSNVAGHTGVSIEDVRSMQTDQLARKAFEQDCVCFGYKCSV